MRQLFKLTLKKLIIVIIITVWPPLSEPKVRVPLSNYFYYESTFEHPCLFFLLRQIRRPYQHKFILLFKYLLGFPDHVAYFEPGEQPEEVRDNGAWIEYRLQESAMKLNGHFSSSDTI